MKSIVYIGATLMIGASIYGFVDYKRTSHNKEFTNMYVEEKKNESVVISEDKIIEPFVKKDPDNPGQKPKDRNANYGKNGVTNRRVVNPRDAAHKEEILGSIIPIAIDGKVAEETNEIEKYSVDIQTSKDRGIVNKIKKKRKLNTKLFSRAALDERYIEHKEKVNLSKEEVKKLENKK